MPLNAGSGSECRNIFSWREKFAIAREIFPCITFLYVAYYSGYLANQGVITTLGFDNSPFSPRDHYQYYTLSYQFGKFLGRSHILITSCTFPSLLRYISVQKTWILAMVELAHLLFFVFCSWYRFVPHVAIIIIICGTGGFTEGSVFVNTARVVSEMFHDTSQREFGMGLVTVGSSGGVLSAGLMGMYVEPHLKKHCLDDLGLGLNCLTRYTSRQSWTYNSKCD